MGSHRPPAPERESRWWWPIMFAAVAGVVLPPVVWSAQHVAPHPAAAQTFTIPPERVAEPSAHGGPLAPMSIGVVATGTTTENALSAPRTPAATRTHVATFAPTQAVTGPLVATETPSESVVVPPTAAASTTAPPVPTTTADPTPTETPATTTEPTPSMTSASATETIPSSETSISEIPSEQASP